MGGVNKRVLGFFRASGFRERAEARLNSYKEAAVFVKKVSFSLEGELRGGKELLEEKHREVEDAVTKVSEHLKSQAKI